jgi:hypothetical protein
MSASHMPYDGPVTQQTLRLKSRQHCQPSITKLCKGRPYHTAALLAASHQAGTNPQPQESQRSCIAQESMRLQDQKPHTYLVPPPRQ